MADSFDNKSTNEFEKTIVETVKTLASSIMAEDEARYKDVLNAIEKEYRRKFKDMDPEVFSTLITFDITEKLNQHLAYRFFPQYAQNCGVMFIVEHYNFISRQLSSVVTEGHNTSACCVDCARWLIKMYIKHLKDVTFIPDMSIDEKCYWKPMFGSGEDWMSLCESIERLYWGQTDAFFSTKEKLLNQSQYNNKDGKEAPCSAVAPIEDAESLADKLSLALSQLHGTCSACSHYSMYHLRGKCRNCRWDTANNSLSTEYEDNWQWCGITAEEKE